MEELRYDRRHAAKMSGARSAAERPAEARDLARRLESLRIHRRGARRVDRVDARPGADAQVVIEGPRVLLEVIPPLELDRVHEDRHDHALRTPARLGDEGEVA